ncbi:uncharacterized protein LOC130135990 [Syzygium oleosum]|uniref:uncharacterized protein LOC130135990 n=1 Tax=Syzygium oleosum TaxID=219896 RepID=UPI0024B9C927|nr:uncharacterized protein LOC130135990 [Syzygium oleosum]
MSAFHRVTVWLDRSRSDGFVCSPMPEREERPRGRDEASWRYWSLKTRKAEGSAAEVSRRTSPEERRETAKENGVVLLRTKTRSEEAAEMRRQEPESGGGGGARVWLGGEGDRRGKRSSGTSHRRWSAFVIRTRRRPPASKLEGDDRDDVSQN